MGFRLIGPRMEFLERAEYLVRDAGALPSNIVLDVTPVGGIQITTGNEAILMGVEVPSIGAFAKPATVISADQSRIGQVRPGEKVRFEVVDAGDAVRIGREQAAVATHVALER
jgi:urea carboxylase